MRRLLRHPHVIEFKEVFLLPEHIAIVMEYASGGNLFSYVQRAVRLKEPAARWFFQQLIIGKGRARGSEGQCTGQACAWCAT